MERRVAALVRGQQEMEGRPRKRAPLLLSPSHLLSSTEINKKSCLILRDLAFWFL